MMSPEVEEKLAPLRARVKQQGDKVRDMKAAGAPDLDVKKEVLELKARRKELEDLTLQLSPPESFDRNKMADLAKRRFFYDSSFAIYGGITGQYDMGPLGCDLVDNLLGEWQRHFVLQEHMLKVNCSILTPESVLRASGHVDKFADYMVKDVVTGDCYRLDHLVKLHLEKKVGDKKTPEDVTKQIRDVLARLDGLDVHELEALVKEHEMKAPATGNPLTPPQEFNLMFPISIGPSGNVKGFLRPETAQGIFVNFKRLLEYNNGRLPFVAAQVGNAYRNEISPRAGLLRVREFTMAEVEHFCDPRDKRHRKFVQVEKERLTLYSAAAQEAGQSPTSVSIGEAVHGGLVANETLGFYMARIQQYLLKVGIAPAKLRFRQHLHNEMAHYACDCWDAECLTSYGWIECVGCADRSAYDLTCHTAATGVKLTVERALPQPKQVDVVVPVLDKGLIGKTFKKDAKGVQDALLSLPPEGVDELDQRLTADGKGTIPGSSFEVTRQMVPSVKKEKKMVHVEEIVPSVIEPSFGIGRIFYSLLEHTFTVRQDDDKRTYFALPCVVAPVKVTVLPLSAKPEFLPYTTQIASQLTEANISVKVDDSTGSIGRRYARTDEASVPFVVTVDFDTLQHCPPSVTLRERDTTQQVRLPVSEVVETVVQLSTGRLLWQEVVSRWPKFIQQEVTK